MHTLCLECCSKSIAPSGSRTKRHTGNSTLCPLCYVPVRPCDVKPHPQLSNLVLLTRKLSRLLDRNWSPQRPIGSENVEVDATSFKSTESPAALPVVIANSPVVCNTKLPQPIVVLENIGVDAEEKENRKFMPPPTTIPAPKKRSDSKKKIAKDKVCISPKAPLASPEKSEMDDMVSAPLKAPSVRGTSSDSDAREHQSAPKSQGDLVRVSSYNDVGTRLNSKGESALHRAAIRNDLEQLRRLLAAGHSPDVRDHAGWTPLHEAALRGYAEAVECLLVDGRASVDVLGGPELETALHEAVFNRRVDAVRVLLEHNANPSFPNGQEITPIMVCERCLADTNQDIVDSAKSTLKGRKALKKDLAQALKEYTDIHCLLMKADKIWASKTSSTKIINDPVASAVFLERRRSKPVLLCTGLDRDQQHLLARVAGLIHARIANDMSSDVTHLITGVKMLSVTEEVKSRRKRGKKGKESQTEASDRGLHCPRTLKYVTGVLQGCWILAFDWIEACAEMKTRVCEEAFELNGCYSSPNTYAPRRGRQAKEAGSGGLFHGYRFCLLGTYTYPFPNRQTLANVLTLGGGKIFHRDIASASRLAYLAVDDPIIACNWMVQDEQEDTQQEVEGSRTTFTALDIKDDGTKVNQHQLIALYDHRASASSSKTVSSEEGSLAAEAATTTAVKPKELVEAALRLLKPRTKFSGAEPPFVTTANYRPIRLIPASWVMISSGDYTLLSLANIDK
ncbi:hypothetical protein Aperf_G00000032265 [Anoplocephala perfoliata]